MQKILRKFYETLPWPNNLAPIAAQWPTAIIVLGVAITPVWAGVLAWYLFHWVALRLWS